MLEGEPVVPLPLVEPVRFGSNSSTRATKKSRCSVAQIVELLASLEQVARELPDRLEHGIAPRPCPPTSSGPSRASHAELQAGSATRVIEVLVGAASFRLDEEEAWDLVHAIREKCVDSDHRPLDTDALRSPQLADVLTEDLDRGDSPEPIEVGLPQARVLADYGRLASCEVSNCERSSMHSSALPEAVTHALPLDDDPACRRFSGRQHICRTLLRDLP
jgi:hypothetical protein